MKRLEDIQHPAGSVNWLTEAAQALQDRLDFIEAKIEAALKALESPPPKK